MKNFLKWLLGAQKPPQQKQPPLRERVETCELEINDLWGAVNSLGASMGGISGRLDALEQRPGVPLPDGYERQMNPETGEEVIVYVGVSSEPLAELEPVEGVSYDAE